MCVCMRNKFKLSDTFQITFTVVLKLILRLRTYIVCYIALSVANWRFLCIFLISVERNYSIQINSHIFMYIYLNPKV